MHFVYLVYLALKLSYHQSFRRYLCPLSVASHWPVFAFHSLTVLSSLPLAIRVPSGLHATDLTLQAMR